MPDPHIINKALQVLERRRDDLIGAIGFGNANIWEPGQLAGLQADIEALCSLLHSLKFPMPSMHQSRKAG